MTKEESKKRAQEIVDLLFHGASLIVRMGKQHHPMLAVTSKYGERTMADLGFLQHKQVMIALWKATAENPHVESATLIIEAWKHGSTPEQMKEERMKKLIAAVDRGDIHLGELEGATECIIINCLVGEHQWMCFCDIDRKARSLKKGELVGTDGEDGAEISGRIVRKKRRMQ